MRALTVTLLTVILSLSLSTIPSIACTSLIVGKAASVDGSVICTYNCDGFGFSGSMKSTPASRHSPGEKIAIRTWGYGPVRGYVEQVEYTYNVIGYINENQVSIVESTFDGRKELLNPEGILDYDSMMHLGLERATTAREAIRIMTDLVERYGYGSTGESITVCDKNEAWILEMIGKGPGRKGAVWVAIRIPDDSISAHANLCRIRNIPFSDKENCMYSKDVVSFAREMGFFKGKDKDFSFRDAYCPISFESVRYADARVWSFFRHHVDDKTVMDAYLPYINGDFSVCDHLPLYIKPDHKLSVRDVFADMRDHYEGTPLDMTTDVSAGPWGMPIRPLPMSWTSEGKQYYRERPIGTQQTGFTLVSQLRGYLPNDLGGVMYFNCDDASMVAYVPVFCSMSNVPAPFRTENNPHDSFSWKSAFWMNNLVANMVYPRYSVMAPDLWEAQKELEDFYADDLTKLAQEVSGLTIREMRAILSARSEGYAKRMMDRWEKLFELLVVKHNDQIVRPTNNGAVVSGRHATPGYKKEFYEQIGKDTGDRYLLPGQDAEKMNTITSTL